MPSPILSYDVHARWSSFLHFAKTISACYYDFERGSFVHYDFETKQETIFDWDGCKELQEETIWSNFIPVLTGYFETRFLAAIREEKSEKLYIVLFDANFPERKISVVDKIFVIHKEWTAVNYRFYLYKSNNDQIFIITFYRDDLLKTTSCVLDKVHVSLTEPSQLVLKSVSALISFKELWFLPFVEDDTLFFLPAKEKNKILIIPLINIGKMEVRDIKCTDVQLAKMGEAVGSPAYYRDRIYFCWASDDKKTCILWSLHLREFVLKCEQLFSTEEFSLLQFAEVAPNGSVFLFAKTKILRMKPTMLHYYITEKTLGQGGFGIVKKGTLEEYGEVAIKISKGTATSHRGRDFSTAEREAKKLMAIKHKNIVSAYRYIREGHRFLLFMELMKRSVRDKVLSLPEHRLDESEALDVLLQALEGLVHLHTLKPNPVIHRDIKCANMLIGEDGTVKLGDFGLVKHISLNTRRSTDPKHATNKPVGTSYWKAPETFDRDAKCSRKSDVWSMGCAWVEMLTGLPPYADFDMTEAEWAYGMFKESLTYDPDDFLPKSVQAQQSKQILKKIFKRKIKQLPQDTSIIKTEYIVKFDQIFRHFLGPRHSYIVQGLDGSVCPHSWDVLAAVKEIKNKNV